MKKMNPEVKERWLKGLRSGEYRQSRGMLRKIKGGMCCLGVLMDIAFPDEWERGDEYGADVWLHDGSLDMPSKKRRLSLGLPKQAASKLADMNDKQGASFKEIADYVEKYL